MSHADIFIFRLLTFPKLDFPFFLLNSVKEVNGFIILALASRPRQDLKENGIAQHADNYHTDWVPLVNEQWFREKDSKGVPLLRF